ncbi:MAG: beta-CASP ribonuclease aCPSF1 [Candidatus Aenigmarchaeota archaeon]|nr:beta-CASP ribonuclease aCPSF1 [Candidatus Aenigmarchaeota archaeon]MDW8149220.1 beta-CASP ribonuclease aCPSF1 [Candidatus Aenigmarchaeota archaeon]
MKIFEEIKQVLGEGNIEKIELEGSEIIVYVKSKEIIINQENYVKEIVNKIKKRVEIRAVKDLLLDEEEAKKKILELVPREANIKEIYFDRDSCIVYILAEKPGLIIGKGAELIRRIKKEIFWSLKIERLPILKSTIMENIRKMFIAESSFRKNFLNEVGKKILKEIKEKRNWIRIIPLGGYGEIGRSCTLLETPKSKILIDCGVNIGNFNEFYPIFNLDEFDYNLIDAIIVSHSHLDHIGAIPLLYEMGYDGPLYMTEPTLHLSTLLWLDFMEVIHKSGLQKFYSIHGIKEAIRRAVTLKYGEVADISSDVKLTFYNAGHILGSAICHLHIGEGLHNIVYAVDQKYGKSLLLDQVNTVFPRLETLIIETTYGAKEDKMPPRKEVEKEFLDIVNKTMERGGICLIPSFSVERAQELMAILYLNNFQHPIYLDGMIWEANEIFSAYPDYMGKTMRKLIKEGKNVFTSDIFKRIGSRQDREKAWEDKPCVIISTSGMLTGGPAIEHLKALCENEKNTLIFVGYQAVGTLGRKIQRGEREILLQENGKQVPFKINMEVFTSNGLSGHSDRRQLLAYIGDINIKPKKIICCHGEFSKTQEFANDVEKIFKIKTFTPINLESVRCI